MQQETIASPAVSVIIPTYNAGPYIRDAIDSALAQTYQDYEIVVVDDASTDGTADVVASYGDRVRLIRRENNSGICEVARSQAIRAARGKYCAFLDQDDLWEPEKLERQVAFMEAHPDFPLCHTYAKVIFEDGSEHGTRHEGAIPATGPCAKELLRHSFITISAIMVRPEAWVSAGDPMALKDLHSDLDYFLAILQRYPAGFGFIDEVLASYRKWPGNISQSDWKKIPKDVVSLERLYRKRLWKGLVTLEEMKEALYEAYVANGNYQYYHGLAGRAARLYAQAWWQRPGRLVLALRLIKASVKSVIRPGSEAGEIAPAESP